MTHALQNVDKEGKRKIMNGHFYQLTNVSKTVNAETKNAKLPMIINIPPVDNPRRNERQVAPFERKWEKLQTVLPQFVSDYQIRKIRYDGDNYTLGARSELSAPFRECIRYTHRYIDFLSNVIQQNPTITELHLSFVAIDGPIARTLGNLLRRTPHLTSLTIYYSSIKSDASQWHTQDSDDDDTWVAVGTQLPPQTPRQRQLNEDIAYFLASFGNITHLTLNRLWGRVADTFFPQKVREMLDSATNLTHLTMYRCGVGREWETLDLQSIPAMPILQVLSLPMCYLEDITLAHFRPIVENGAHLTTLNLNENRFFLQVAINP